MKSIFTAAAVVIGITAFPTTAHEAEPPQRPEITIQTIEVDLLTPLPLSEEPKPEPERVVHKFLQTPEREAWLERLITCESGGNPGALNPVDRDGTPSHGLLQFKRETFEWAASLYGIVADLYDAEAQKEIVRRWMDEPSIIWENQFPDCVRKLGRPPGT